MSSHIKSFVLFAFVMAAFSAVPWSTALAQTATGNYAQQAALAAAEANANLDTLISAEAVGQATPQQVAAASATAQTDNQIAALAASATQQSDSSTSSPSSTSSGTGANGSSSSVASGSVSAINPTALTGAFAGNPPGFTGSNFGLWSPQNYQVFQRGADNTGNIYVIGLGPVGMQSLAILVGNSNWVLTSAQCVNTGGSNNLAYSMKVPAGGWYTFGVVAFNGPCSGLWGTGTVLSEQLIGNVGVGEVFITAGQSNTTPNGEGPQPNGPFTSNLFDPGLDISSTCSYCYMQSSPKNPQWFSWIDPNFNLYQTNYASNPQSLGTVWASFATVLSEKLGVPVAISEVGMGGTRITQWLPPSLQTSPADTFSPTLAAWSVGASGLFSGSDLGQPGALYNRLLYAVNSLNAMGGFRAVLWDQGGSDVVQLASNWLGMPTSLTSGLNVPGAITFPQGSVPGTIASNPYFNGLAAMVTNLRMDSQDWSMPWVIAKASYFPSAYFNTPSAPVASDVDGSASTDWNAAANCKSANLSGANTETIPGTDHAMPSIVYNAMDLVSTAQQWTYGYYNILQGPNFDQLVGAPHRYYGQNGSSVTGICVHLSMTGLAEGGNMWASSVLNGFTFPPNPKPITPATSWYQFASISTNDNSPLSPAANADDNNPSTAFISRKFFNQANEVIPDNSASFIFLEALLPSAMPVSHLKLTARMYEGSAQAFPAIYDVFLTSSDDTFWIYVGQYNDQPDQDGNVTIQFPQTYQTSGIALVPRVLGADQYGKYYFQMAEIALGP